MKELLNHIMNQSFRCRNSNGVTVRITWTMNQNNFIVYFEVRPTLMRWRFSLSLFSQRIQDNVSSIKMNG